MAAVTIVIVDDHTIFRQALSELLETSDTVDVLAAAAGVEEAVAAIATHVPQVALIDLDLGPDSGLAVIEAARERSPGTRYLVLSASGTPHDLQRAMTGGAAGYLLKGVTSDQLVDAVVRVAAGETVIDPELVPMLVDQLASGREQLGSGLTVREHEVLLLVAKGATSDAVARELGISARTVQKHLENIYRKVGVSSRAELVSTAFRTGLLR